MKPTSITKARYQVAYQREDATGRARREMRHRHRQRLRPPGFTPTKWAMAADMEYAAGHKDSDERYTVPKGFPFDGASVPFLLTMLVPRTHSSYLGAAALHDYFYRKRRMDVPRNGKQPEMPVGRFLAHGKLSYPFAALWVLVLWMSGFTLDLLNLGQYRREADAVAAQDQN